jgi:hypothetical protein
MSAWFQSFRGWLFRQQEPARQRGRVFTGSRSGKLSLATVVSKCYQNSIPMLNLVACSALVAGESFNNCSAENQGKQL